MTHEIERKFLVLGTDFLSGAMGVEITQSYLCKTDKSTVRVRISGEQAWLALKGRSVGIKRREFEYRIPLADAERMMAELCSGPVIRKTRYALRHADHVWDVDVFHGDNNGLVVAEIELQQEDETFARPAWLGEEVSSDFRYSNSNLSVCPFRLWQFEYPAELPGLSLSAAPKRTPHHAVPAHPG